MGCFPMGQASILRSSSGVKGLPVVFILSGFMTVFLFNGKTHNAADRVRAPVLRARLRRERRHERLAGPRRPVCGNERMISHLSSSGRKFHERREGGEAGTEREEHPFLAGLWPAAVQDLPQDKQNGG